MLYRFSQSNAFKQINEWVKFAAILYGEYCETPHLFHQAIRDFFTAVSTKYEGLKSGL
jgi:hypothetical protein